MGTIKALSCAWMAGKKEFSAVVVKCVQEFFPDISECLTASPDRAVGSWRWNFGNDTFSILNRIFKIEFRIQKVPHYANYTNKENYREQVKEVW